MKIRSERTVPEYDSYRSERVRSLFNVDGGTGSTTVVEADLPLDGDWQIGMVVGPSGSGKSSIAAELEKAGWTVWGNKRWPKDKPIIDAIDPRGDFDSVTGALAGVGLGTVPSWLRPYPVLSMGEQFRAEMARLLIDRPDRAILDEFTSTIDRQVACIGAMAFAKAWRRGPGQLVLATCHHDVVEYVAPDWVWDTGTQELLTKECLQPPTEVEPPGGPDRLAVLEFDF